MARTRDGGLLTAGLRMMELSGLAVSPGVAIGQAYMVEIGAIQVPDYCLSADQVPAEQARFAEAVARARRQIRKLKAKTESLPESAAEEVGYLLDAHLAMLTESRLIRGVQRRIGDLHQNAESAVQAEIGTIKHSFAQTGDSYLSARIADVREVGTRLIRNLLQHEYQAFSGLPAGTIIIAEELSPAETALLDPARVAGFAAVLGGAEGHTAIMARSLGLPAVLGIPGLTEMVGHGDTVVVDGSRGRVLVNPDAAAWRAALERRDAFQQERVRLRGFGRLPAITRDGTVIAMQANLEMLREVPPALEAGAAGVGLLRTEFMFMNRTDLPNEDEQYERLREIVVGMDGRPVTARTLDIGGDKLSSIPGLSLGEPANPALGLRAVRLGLREPELLKTQLSAMLRAGVHGPLRILLPMICTTSEVRRVRELLELAARDLRRRHVRCADPLPPLGVMIEIPGAALSADALAAVADFMAVGTNDLIQYTLAIDRGDDQVAALYDPLHPAVLRLIQFTIEAALRAGRPFSLCGEMAGDPRHTALLLGLGVRELSMTAGSIARVKQRIRALDLGAATRRAQIIMAQSDSRRITMLLEDFNRSETEAERGAADQGSETAS